MRKIAVLAAALMLAGCATVPVKEGNPVSIKRAAAAKVAPQPIETTTPNQIVKKRWYDRFKVHPKWFSK